MHGLIEIHTGSMIIRLLVIFTIRENFRKFPWETKFPENLQPYLPMTGRQGLSAVMGMRQAGQCEL